MSFEKNDIFHNVFKSNDFKDSFIDVCKNSRRNGLGSIPTISVSVRFPEDTFTKLKMVSKDINTSVSKLSYLIITSFIEEYTRKHEN